MATEVTTPITDTDPPLGDLAALTQAVADEPLENAEPPSPSPAEDGKSGKRAKGEERATAQQRRHQAKPFQEIQHDDNVTLADYIKGLGVGESLRIDVVRKEPKTWTDPTGKVHNLGGFCGNHFELIDEEKLKELYGGGLYTLRINTPSDKGGLSYFKARDVRISGDPKPAGYNPAGAAKPEASDTMVKEAFNVLKEQAKGNAKPTGIDPAMQMLLEQMKAEAQMREQQHQREMARRDAELKELREQMREDRERAGKPPEAESFKDKMLSTMMDSESTRMTALRENHASEIRQLKEGNAQEIARIHDRHERDVARMEKVHDREVAQLNENHKRELDMLRMGKDNELAAAKVSADTQKALFTAENNRLIKENDRLADEVKELRAKKDKSVIEMVKEMKTIKEAVGADDEKEESMGEKLVEAAPMIIDQIGQAIGKVTNKGAAPAAQQQQQQQQQQQAAQRRPQLVKDDATGNVFKVHNGKLIPVKKPGQKVQLADPEGKVSEVEIPAIDPAKIEFAVNYLERAFSGQQEPETVAISIKPNIPEEILTAISNLGGIDAFMTRVAKLPGSSPLASQAGKNWVRKVGKALVGE